MYPQLELERWLLFDLGCRAYRCELSLPEIGSATIFNKFRHEGPRRVLAGVATPIKCHY